MRPVHCDKCFTQTVTECPCSCHPLGAAYREAKRLRLAAIEKADRDE